MKDCATCVREMGGLPRKDYCRLYCSEYRENDPSLRQIGEYRQYKSEHYSGGTGWDAARRATLGLYD